LRQIGGSSGEFLFAGRLDNLGSCHAATSALIAAGGAGAATHSRVIVLYDHEEVGSRSASGAAGPFLEHSLERIVAAMGGEGQAAARALSRSLLVSADMAHAVHPNYAERHEPGHKPVVGGGPVIKTNVNLSYASDAPATRPSSPAVVRLIELQRCRSQRHAVRTTIAPLTASRVGISVDVGSPMPRCTRVADGGCRRRADDRGAGRVPRRRAFRNSVACSTSADPFS
jgi:aspartyl aminopeptidase